MAEIKVGDKIKQRSLYLDTTVIEVLENVVIVCKDAQPTMPFIMTKERFLAESKGDAQHAAAQT